MIGFYLNADIIKFPWKQKTPHKKSAQEALLVNYVGTDYPKYDLRILLLEF